MQLLPNITFSLQELLTALLQILVFAAIVIRFSNRMERRLTRVETILELLCQEYPRCQPHLDKPTR